MKDYDKIQGHCMTVSRISEQLLDNFLMGFIADRENLETQFDNRMAIFKKIVSQMPPEWLKWTVGQYICHCIFKKGGLAAKYARMTEVKKRSGAELELLETYLKHPWRYSFCSISERLTPQFFEMRDIFTGENFLLYSPGIGNVIEEIPEIKSFFLLLGDNGMCQQTYGTMAYFKGFQSFDFFYFAKLLDPNIDFPSDAQAVVERDPLPFSLLFRGGEYPLTTGRGEVMAHCYSEFHVEVFNPDGYSRDFEIDAKQSLFRLQLKSMYEFPHYSICYFHKKKKHIVLTAMTRIGYKRLIEALNKSGHGFPNQPDAMATVSMVTLAKQILGRDFQVDPYVKSFQEKHSPESKGELTRINRFAGLFMEAFNRGEKDPDISAMAAKAGLDMEKAQMLVRQMMEKLGGQF